MVEAAANTMIDSEMITISEFGGANPRRVSVVGVQCSWELSNVGTFSGFCRMAELRSAGLSRDLAGSWIEYRSPGAPSWGGVITGRPTGDGVVEVGADGWGALLGGQVIDVWDRQVVAPPAALARRALMLVGGGESPLFVSMGVVEEGGESVSFELGGQKVLDDALPELAEEGELEWVVDSDRKLHVGRRIGRDLSASIRLVEGWHFVQPDVADDILARQPDRVYTIESDEATAQRMIRRGRIETTVAVPQLVTRQITVLVKRRKKRGWRPQTITVSDLVMTQVVKSASSVGLPELGGGGVATWPEQRPGVGTHALLAANGKGLEPQTTPAKLVVKNRDDLWRRVSIGDVVRISFASVDFSGWFRLVAASLDTTDSSMTWAGELLPDARTT